MKACKNGQVPGKGESPKNINHGHIYQGPSIGRGLCQVCYSNVHDFIYSGSGIAVSLVCCAVLGQNRGTL